MESHFISLFGTDKYFNIRKSGWGISNFIPNRDDWQLFDLDKENEVNKLKNENNIMQYQINRLNQQVIKLQQELDCLTLQQKLLQQENEIGNSETVIENKVEETSSRQIKIPDFILNKSLYKNKITKNKSSNDTKMFYDCNNRFFYARHHKETGHYSIPCKLILYVNGKKKEWMYFDSVKECSDFTGLYPKQISDSMMCIKYRTYFKYDDIYGYLSVFDERKCHLKQYDVLIKICAITPLTEKGKELLSN